MKFNTVTQIHRYTDTQIHIIYLKIEIHWSLTISAFAPVAVIATLYVWTVQRAP